MRRYLAYNISLSRTDVYQTLEKRRFGLVRGKTCTEIVDKRVKKRDRVILAQIDGEERFLVVYPSEEDSAEDKSKKRLVQVLDRFENY